MQTTAMFVKNRAIVVRPMHVPLVAAIRIVVAGVAENHEKMIAIMLAVIVKSVTLPDPVAMKNCGVVRQAVVALVHSVTTIRLAIEAIEIMVEAMVAVELVQAEAIVIVRVAIISDLKMLTRLLTLGIIQSQQMPNKINQMTLGAIGTMKSTPAHWLTRKCSRRAPFKINRCHTANRHLLHRLVSSSKF